MAPTTESHALRAKRLGVDTHDEAVIYMRSDCHVCRAEGFSGHARIRVTTDKKSIIATLNTIVSDILSPGEAGFSESAWRRLGVSEGDKITVAHARALDSLSRVRGKVYGQALADDELAEIMRDIVQGRYSDIHLSSFITACAARGLSEQEIVGLTRAMVDAGERLTWSATPIVDKHCVGGLPGNRTTPIIVAIVAACGLTMPKTSSRAITSPAGTADAMETLAPVDLNLAAMRRVVEREGGCVVWGGAVSLSPADDTLIRVERALDIDSEGQLVASVLSKKAAAGATHLVLDLPVGPTAKVRSSSDADSLSEHLLRTAKAFGIEARAIRTDGRQPVRRGVGPALEARDVLAVLEGAQQAPLDLKARAVTLAGVLLELGGAVASGGGEELAEKTLADGRALAKFQAICEAQGGMRTPPIARQQWPLAAHSSGRVTSVDNRRLAKAAKLAGAPGAKAAGLEMHVRLDDLVEKGSPLFTLHAETSGELEYARDFIESHPPIIDIEPAK